MDMFTRRRMLLVCGVENPVFFITYNNVKYEYEFEEGMTWSQFISSNYNDGNFTYSGTKVFFRSNGEISSVITASTIIENTTYSAIDVPAEPTSYTLIGTFTSSGTYTVPADGWYQIELQGASGTGGHSASGNKFYSGGGGGGGGCAISRVRLKKNDTVVYTLGKYNTAQGSTSPSMSNHPKAGDSSATINSSVESYTTMSVTGAKNGQSAVANDTSNNVGGTGGTASGGTYNNYKGGTGGTGSNGEVYGTKNIAGGTGGTAGYTGGNAGGKGAGYNKTTYDYDAENGKNAFIKIYRGNTN